jgi:large subunit ribosomal protein L22
MQVSAKSKYVRVSPYKLRPIVDVIRGKSVSQSLAYLKTHMTKRVRPIIKVIDSAYANAKNLHKDVDSPDLFVVKKIFVDQGPVLKYYTPAAMGRAAVQRKRLSHITVVLEKKV